MSMIDLGRYLNRSYISSEPLHAYIDMVILLYYRLCRCSKYSFAKLSSNVFILIVMIKLIIGEILPIEVSRNSLFGIV